MRGRAELCRNNPCGSTVRLSRSASKTGAIASPIVRARLAELHARGIQADTIQAVVHAPVVPARQQMATVSPKRGKRAHPSGHGDRLSTRGGCGQELSDRPSAVRPNVYVESGRGGDSFIRPHRRRASGYSLKPGRNGAKHATTHQAVRDQRRRLRARCGLCTDADARESPSS